MSLAQKYQFKYPPEKQLCQKHRLATRIWKGIKQDSFNQIQNQICQCCNRRVGEKVLQTQCCYSSTQLSFLGVGVPLYFSYMKYSIVFLILLSIIFCIFGLYTNIVSNNCQGDQICKPNIFNTLSIINKKNEINYMSIQNYILLSFVIICIILFQFFRVRFRKKSYQIDQFFYTPSDYSMILNRLPQGIRQQDIEALIQQKRNQLTEEEKQKTDNLKVQKIILSYNLTEYDTQKNKYLQEFKELIKKEKQYQFKMPQLPKPTQPGYLAIVVFSKQCSKKLFFQEPKFLQKSLYFFFASCLPLSDYRIKDQRISIQRAPQPDDIIWNNSNVSICQQIIRKFFFGSISLMFLFAGGCAQYGLALLQKNIVNSGQRIFIGTLASIVVAITNLILQYYLIYSTFFEKMNTMTEYMNVLTFKLVLLQFLNSGIFVVLATILANLQSFNIQNNLSQTITQIMILNAITQSVSNFFLYKFDITGRILRWMILQLKCCIYTQLQANKLSQLPIPSIPYKYSYIIKTLWLTGFYAPFVPIVVPISIIGLIFNYLIQKLLFGKSYSMPPMISSAVNNSCIQLLQFIPLIISLGQFLIYLYFQKFQIALIPQYWSIPIYFSIGISIVNLILPMGKFNKMLFEIQKDQQNLPTYSQIQNQFEVTYQITNPAYQEKRQRLGDIYASKRLFGKPPQRNTQMHEIKNNNSFISETSQRSYNYPLLNIGQKNQNPNQIISPLNYLKQGIYRQNGKTINKNNKTNFIEQQIIYRPNKFKYPQFYNQDFAAD